MQQLVKVWINRLNSWSSFRGSSISVFSFVGCLALLMVLGWLCQEVWEKEAFSFDTIILLWIHQSATPTLDSIMLNITGLADPLMVAVIFFGTEIWLWRKRKYLQIKVFAIACVGGLALTVGLKLFFAKPRPQLWHQLIVEKSSSFPSGHALGSIVVYGFLS
jgi:undecaprenyl-diphosphatase